MAFLSKFHVEVDGEEVAKLKHGESATVDVPVGAHSLQVHATGLTDGSTEIDVPDEGIGVVAGSKQSLGSAAKSNYESGAGKKMAIEFWSADDAE